MATTTNLNTLKINYLTQAQYNEALNNNNINENEIYITPASKPTYTAAEVGALPDTTIIPTKISDLTNDAGYLTSYTETDPTVPAWAKAASKPTYTANEVGALPSTTVIPTITDTYSSTSHDGMSGVAVNSAITTAIGNINSFDITVVSSTSAVTTPNNHTIYFVPQAVNSSTHDEYMYINNNWELIGTTTVDLSGYLQKTEIADWAKAANKPSYTATEVGAIATTHAAATITLTDISNWNAKSDFSGSYNDLEDKPTIPAAQVQSDWNATTGMGVILNKPTIPTVPIEVSAFINDSGYLTLADLPIYDGTIQNG